MKNDELFQHLREAYRAQKAAERPDEVWEDLTLGEADTEVRKELERQAESDPKTAELLARHAPLGEAAQARIVDAILKQSSGGGTVGQAQSDDVAPEQLSEREHPERGKVVQLLPRVWRGVVPALAVAAATVLILRAPGGAPLPTYQQSWTSQVSEMRSDPTTKVDGPVTLHTSARFQFVARPTSPDPGPIVARGAIRSKDGWRAWNVPIDVSEHGSVRVYGPVSKHFPHGEGIYEVCIVIHRADAMSDEALLRVAKDAESSDADSTRVECRTVQVVPTPR